SLDDELDRIKGTLTDSQEREGRIGANLAIARASIKLAKEIAAGEIEGDAPRSWRTLMRRWGSGTDIETAWRAIHEADTALLMVAPAAIVQARLPEIRAGLLTTLGESDGRAPGYLKILTQAEARLGD